MNSLFENTPKIIEEASKSLLGLIALIILVISFIGYLFFFRESVQTKVGIFLITLFSFFILIILVFRTVPYQTEDIKPPLEDFGKIIQEKQPPISQQTIPEGETPRQEQPLDEKPKVSKEDEKLNESPTLIRKKPAEIEKEDEQLNKLSALINRDALIYPNATNVVVVIESTKTKSGLSPNNLLSNLLSSLDINIVSNYFKEEAFKTKGFFKQIYDGNTDLLKKANALSEIDYLIFGKLNYSFRKAGVIDGGLISCDVNFSYKTINNNAQVIRSDIISVIGASFVSDDDALKRGLEMISEKYYDRIFKQI